MKRIILCLAAVAAAMAIDAKGLKNVDEVVFNGLRGVNIKGILWAEHNVGANSVKDNGAYFTWEEAQDACPYGWRLPTAKEFKKLSRVKSEWLAEKDVRCFQGKVFFPSIGKLSGYWSSTPAKGNYARVLLFDMECVWRPNRDSAAKRDRKLPVRCVKK